MPASSKTENTAPIKPDKSAPIQPENSVPTKSENIYVTELKSLLKDKFFMMLLGISVAIVLLSSVYSVIRPKNDNGQLASGVQTSTKAALVPKEVLLSPTPQVKGEDRTIAGLEPLTNEKAEEKGKTTSILGSITSKIKEMFTTNKNEAELSPTPMSQQETPSGAVTSPPQQPKKGGTYVAVEGDNLWQIAEKAYGSGYNNVDIVSANGLINPDYIEVGQKLIIPSVEAKMPTSGDITAQAA
jgi:hypothetical protein